MAVNAARAKSLFLTASDFADAAERAAYLDRECAGDAELRARVEALLRANEAAPRPAPEAENAANEQTLEGLSPTVQHGDPTARIGSIIVGKYKLIEEIGEGGMGQVFMAQQTEPVKRAVAVKVIKAGMDSRSVLARFEAERQALAMMDHPNIAKVLDAGTTDGGRPFFVMELVKGMPITQFSDERKLTPRQRLELFVPVCQAIQHAHQKGVIHRDIKPSNVLIALYDDRPVPKVIDFGVAKAAGQTLTEKTLMTGLGAVVGTAEYMSPEQASLNNLDIDTRSDVYSLGVLLYELLTGSTPVDRTSLGKAALLEILRIVREVDVPKPSAKLSSSDTLPKVAANRSTEPAKLSKLMKGELDWLVLKALEKDRTRRYETANGLARDIQRYLADEVVEARPPSAGYRLKKFFRRNKGTALAGAAVSVALMAGVAAVLMVQERAKRDVEAKNSALEAERAKVEQRFEIARKSIATFHTVITGEKALENDAFKSLRTKLLTEAAGFYRELEGLLAGETDAKSRSALADGLFQLGELTEKIGDKTQALAAYRKALALRRDLAAAPGANVETRLDVARSLREVGQALGAIGDSEGALRAIEEMRDLSSKLEAQVPTDAVRQSLAQSHFSIGNVLSRTGKLGDSLASHEKARNILQKLADANPSVSEYQSELCSIHSHIGSVLAKTDKLADALASYKRARDIQQKLADANPAVAIHQSELARIHANIGVELSKTGKLADSLVSHEKARDIIQKLAAANPAVTVHQSELARIQGNIGVELSKLGKTRDSLVSHEKARDIIQKLVDANPAVTVYQSNLALTLNNIATQLWKTDKLADALAAFEKARDIQQKLADASPAVTAYQSALALSHFNIGTVLTQTGKPVDALAAYRKSQIIRQELADANPAVINFRRDLVRSHSYIGRQLLRMGKRTEALPAFEKARDVIQKVAGANPTVTDLQSELAECHNQIGLVLSAAGKPAEALAAHEMARDIIQKLADANPAGTQFQSTLARSHHMIGTRLKQIGKPLEALATHERARDIQQKLTAANPTVNHFLRELADSHRSIGLLLSMTGEPAEALAAFQKARDIIQTLANSHTSVPDYRSDLSSIHNDLGRLHAKAGRFAEAFRALDAGLEIRQKLVEADPKTTLYTTGLGYNYAYRGWALMRAGKPKEAATDLRQAVARLAKDPAQNIETRFENARALALLAKLGTDPKAGLTFDEVTGFADKAVSALADALKAGSPNLSELKESDFDAIRGRDDFKKFVADREAQAPKK